MCGSEDVREIVHGLHGWLEPQQIGGGCCPSDYDPDFICGACQMLWRHDRFPFSPAWEVLRDDMYVEGWTRSVVRNVVNPDNSWRFNLRPHGAG